MRKTIRKISPWAVSLLLAAPVAAAEITLTFATEAKREVWILPERPSELSEAGQEFTAGKFPVSVPEGLEDGFAVVYEPETGNVAIRGLAEMEAGAWQVQREDWRIARVTVSIQSAGKPVISGFVTLSGPGYQEQHLLFNGEAAFFAVPPGEVTVRVRYPGPEGEKTAPSQKFVLDLERADRGTLLTVALPEDAPVAPEESPSPTQEPSGAAQQSPEQGRRGSPLGSAIIWVAALALGGGVLWLAFHLIRRNETLVAQKLRSLGVQIPGSAGDADDDDAPPVITQTEPEEPPLVPEGHCPYCGKALGPAGTCDCQISTTGAQQPPAPSATATPPAAAAVARLVADAGVNIEVPEGVSVLGREPASAQLLVADTTVSRCHAEFTRTAESVLLKDLGSSNGTFVNGVRIEAETELKSGDTVQFGAAKFRYED
ncbi:MAG: FHA domain-containing protein [Armatimonadetes bacterium]|nr:FHA domain-containing protein [Armatimonadota bacterium]